MATFNFPPNSRYFGIDTATTVDARGRTVIYLRRRFVPPPDRFALLQEYVVTENDRLDHIAAKFMDDAEAFWRIADANAAMRPEALVEQPGRRLRITLPEGIPGPVDA